LKKNKGALRYLILVGVIVLGLVAGGCTGQPEPPVEEKNGNGVVEEGTNGPEEENGEERDKDSENEQDGQEEGEANDRENDNGENLENDVEKSGLPVELDEWVDYSREMNVAQAVEEEDTLYLLVTYGKRPTGGYEVEIKDVVEEENQLSVYVEFTAPAPNEPVTSVSTYPYDLKEIEPSRLPVEFYAEGAEEYVPRLQGLEVLLPPVDGSERIKVFSPDPQKLENRKIELSGVANVFEGRVVYRLLDSQGNELLKKFTTGSMGNWGYFEETLEVPDEVESGQEILLELYSESARDGSIQDLVRIELTV